MHRFAALIAAFALAACGGPSDAPPRPEDAPQAAAAVSAAEAYMARREGEVVGQLRALLAMPNVADNRADIRRNADALVAYLAGRGVEARVLEAPGVPAAVYGELNTPGATRTLLFYAHFDGQPTGAPEHWATPAFEPTLRGGRLEDGAAIIPWRDARYPLPDEARIYARSASDDKAPIIAMLAAIDAMREGGVPLSANIKFFLEGEEEAGSPHLAQTLEAHRDLLASDLWIFGDGPIDPRGLPRVVLGVRGITSFRLTVYGANTSLHSGHYGNVAPNPAARLAYLITSMRAPDGAITMPGFDGARPSPRILALAREAYDTEGMLEGPQINEVEAGLSYGEALLRPALNVTQLSYGGTGAQRNAIDPEASAGFDIRLIPGITPDAARNAVETHLRTQGYVLINDAPTPEQRRAHPRLARIEWGDLGYAAASAPLDHPGVNRIIDVMRVATNDEVRIAPLIGGSLPIAPIGDVLGAPFVIVPIVNADNNQHAPNENIRMREFRRGVSLYAALLAEGGHW
ncbi:MAG: M20/M25/M40 family metallo-hydrolase [Hyphomonadaceae bacterium]